MIEYTTTWRCRVGASEPLNMVSVVDIKIPPTAGWRVVIYQNKPAYHIIVLNLQPPALSGVFTTKGKEHEKIYNCGVYGRIIGRMWWRYVG